MRRLLAGAVTAGVLAGGLSACGHNDIDQRTVLDALSRSMSSPRSFAFVDQDLDHKTAVSGEVQDALRYRLLLNVDGRPVWQEVVRDDAVADLFLQPSAVTAYAGNGSSPAVDVVADFQALAALYNGQQGPLPKHLFDQLPQPQPVAPSLSLAALQQGKWVLDPVGAPALPSIGTAASQLATSPFLSPLLMLASVRDTVDHINAGAIKQWRKDDLSPTFKPGTDPFPPPGPGEVRFDVREADLPTITATSRGSRPGPPSDFSFRKLSIYLRDGRVAAIRDSYDVLDRLQDLARLYQVPLKLNKSAGSTTEERIGQLIVEIAQVNSPVPFRVHEDTMLLSYPSPAPDVTLPSPAVQSDLSLLPGQGKAAATGASPAPASSELASPAATPSP